MSNKTFGRILVELNGVVVDISDLPKDKYEAFLDLTHKIRVAYIAIKNNRKKP